MVALDRERGPRPRGLDRGTEIVDLAATVETVRPRK